MDSRDAHVVARHEAQTGARGERLLARGRHVALRLWERQPGGETAPAHANPHEYVAYVQSRTLGLRIGGHPAVEVDAGGPYVVPGETAYGVVVLETATVLEAFAPPDHLS